jgi:PAS domain-containing protein
VRGGTSRDITDLKAAEEALREARTDLHATLAAFPDLVFEVDAEGRIHGYHAPTPERLCAPPAAFLGKTVEEVLSPDAARTILDALEQAVRHGTHRGAMYALDLRGGRRWFDLSIAARRSFSSPAFSRWRTPSRRWLPIHPYRAAVGIQDALDEIARGRGTVYDEGAVSACLDLFAEGCFDFDLRVVRPR